MTESQSEPEPADRTTTVPGAQQQGLVQPEGVNAGSDDVVDEGRTGSPDDAEHDGHELS